MDFLKNIAEISLTWLGRRIFGVKKYEYYPNDEMNKVLGRPGSDPDIDIDDDKIQLKFLAIQDLSVPEKYTNVHNQILCLKDDAYIEPKKTPNVKSLDVFLDHHAFIAGNYVENKLIFPNNKPLDHDNFNNEEATQDNSSFVVYKKKLIFADFMNKYHSIKENTKQRYLMTIVNFKLKDPILNISSSHESAGRLMPTNRFAQ